MERRPRAPLFHMLHRNRDLLLLLALTAALAVPAGLLASRVADGMGLGRPYDVDYVPQGSAARLLGPGLRLSIANLYWLSSVQYMGDDRANERGWDKLYPLLDLVTDLDPRHGYAYHTGGVFFISAARIDEADRILEKGYRSGPKYWSFPFYLGFNALFYRGDTEAAARWVEIAARTPGASTRIAALATALKLTTGSPENAVRFIEELRDTAKDEKTAAALEEQYKLTVLQRDFARLDEAVRRYREERKQAPGSLSDLVAAGLVPEIPKEPFGGRYVYDARDGRVHSTAKDVRIEPIRRTPLPRPKPWVTK